MRSKRFQIVGRRNIESRLLTFLFCTIKKGFLHCIYKSTLCFLHFDVIHRPFSLSEELTHYAHKIDFLGEEGEEDLENVNDDETVTDSKQDPAKREKWPWESVHTKLRFKSLFIVLFSLSML